MTQALSSKDLSSEDLSRKILASKVLPGSPGVWLFIYIELTTFALLFLAYAVQFRLNSDMFNQGQAQLHLSIGISSTVFLLTASALVVASVNALHRQYLNSARHYLSLALLMGLGYVVGKVWEWVQLYKLGYSLHYDVYFFFYFFLTLFHWLHVLFGIIMLTTIRVKLNNPEKYPVDMTAIESVASYWHMVDLLWLLVFLLVYIM